MNRLRTRIGPFTQVLAFSDFLSLFIRSVDPPPLSFTSPVSARNFRTYIYTQPCRGATHDWVAVRIRTNPTAAPEHESQGLGSAVMWAPIHIEQLRVAPWSWPVAFCLGQCAGHSNSLSPAA